MSLLTMAQALAKNVGLAVPSAVVTSSDRAMVEVLQFANETGEELARRVDWGVLNEVTTLTGDSTFKTFDLPAGFGRLPRGIAVKAGDSIVRPLSRAEWNLLSGVEGTPRYFLLEGNDITLWPYLATDETATVNYQTLYWCDNGTAAFAADDDESLIDEDLFLKALIVRWRRQKGMDYADFEAEYEGALRDYAAFDDRGRL